MVKRQWMADALRLHFDENFSRMAISKLLNIPDSTLFEFFHRVQKDLVQWPLPAGMTLLKLENILYPGKSKKAQKKQPVSSPVHHKKQRRPNFPEDFKRRLVEQSLQPGANVAQLAREHGINDNLLFNWRRKYQLEHWKSAPDVPAIPALLMPVEITEEPPEIIDVAPQRTALSGPDNSLCCEMVLPGGTLKLSGTVTPALLRMLFDELKGASS